MEIVGVLLCGGSASRFGGDKLLAGTPPIAVRAAGNLLGATGRALAVIPLARPALRAMLEGAGCEVIETDRTASGMGASLAAGIEAAAGADGWIVALGDMPAVPVEVVAAVRAALLDGAALAAPFDEGGKRGHPVGFSAALRGELLALEGDTGARDVLARHAGGVHRVVTASPGIFLDVDTREDLARLATERSAPSWDR